MDILIFSLDGVLPICIPVLIGMLLRKLGIIDKEFASKLNTLCFKVFIPVSIYGQIYQSDLSSVADPRTLVFSLGMTGLVLILLCLITPKLIHNGVQCGEFIQGVFRSNSAILGLPLLQNLYGTDAGKALAIPLPLMIIMYNICAPIVLTHFSNNTSKAPSLREFCGKVFTNPYLIAAILGILTATTGIKFPTFLQKTVSNIGGIGSPLALVALGAITELEHFKRSGKLAFVASIIRLVIIPVIVLTIGGLIGIRGVQMSVLLCFFATPTAVGGYVLAKNIDHDGELAGQILLQTTILSFLTMFLLIATMRAIGWM